LYLSATPYIMKFNAKLLINALGILITLAGGLILVLKSSMLVDALHTSTANNNPADGTKRALPQDKYVKIGGYMIIAGSVIQFISNSLP
jgi:hypothetical protein